MTFKEFKRAIKEWGKLYNYKPVVEIDFDYVYIMFEDDGYPNAIYVHKTQIFDGALWAN